MRKSFCPSPVCKRVITSLGRTTPRELPNLRTLSSTMAASVITIVITGDAGVKLASAHNRNRRNLKPALVTAKGDPESCRLFRYVVDEDSALFSIFAPDRIVIPSLAHDRAHARIVILPTAQALRNSLAVLSPQVANEPLRRIFRVAITKRVGHDDNSASRNLGCGTVVKPHHIFSPASAEQAGADQQRDNQSG